MMQKGIGPGALITAAFIGPGTVTVCTLAGVDFGYSLLWVIILSVAVCCLLQEMAARLGMVSRRGLAETLRNEISNSTLRWLTVAIMLSAIVIGNSAYEAGNISGGALGLAELLNLRSLSLGGVSVAPANLVIATAAFALLLIGSYRVLERVLLVLVVMMSIAFVIVAVATRPSISALASGFVPSMSLAQTLVVIGLIGTTVVPYNLFLHASIVQQKWSGPEFLADMRRDTFVSIGIGGVISMAIVISAASMRGSDVTNVVQLAQSLEPVFGPASRFILAFGLLAAGITSAITAPLAAAFVAAGCLGWDMDLKSRRCRLVWMAVLFTGLLFSLLGGSPIQIIRFAQIANGILLPLIVLFLLWAMNRQRLLGSYVNSRIQNIFGVLVLIVVASLSLRTLWLLVS